MIDRSELFRHFNSAKSYADLIILAEDFGNAIEAGDLRIESVDDAIDGVFITEAGRRHMPPTLPMAIS